MRKRKKSVRTKRKNQSVFHLVVLCVTLVIAVYAAVWIIMDYRTKAADTIKLGTFEVTIIPSATTIPTTPPNPDISEPPTPTTPPAAAVPTSPPAAGKPITVTALITGGPKPPNGYYCIDDHDPDMCDDKTSHLVPKGSGGASTAACGSIIEQAHKLALALPQDDKIDDGKGVRDYMVTPVSSPCGSTGPYSKGKYVSTMFVIDAFNLAGFKELSKANASHVSPSEMFKFWQSPPAGYQYVPYSPAVVKEFAEGKRDLTGCVMFMKTSASYHIGIVNKLEVTNTSGAGVFSILQAASKMYIDRFPVDLWAIRNTSTNQTTTDGVVGFGCHT